MSVEVKILADMKRPEVNEHLAPGTRRRRRSVYCTFFNDADRLKRAVSKEPDSDVMMTTTNNLIINRMTGLSHKKWLKCCQCQIREFNGDTGWEGNRAKGRSLSASENPVRPPAQDSGARQTADKIAA
ncbi:hypothetical protein NIM72_12325 [Pantoea sp. B550]|uniref:hypothetical protein n=1 Tax=Pantoea sp. B550 TaxID=2959338 RepID=UPI00209CE634|nr:hypothetical protein [Pantoea sp. B550]MCP1206317.1 hypothetical protein [Pantoea sp. B550]